LKLSTINSFEFSAWQSVALSGSSGIEPYALGSCGLAATFLPASVHIC
jgi:hypothetical protein